MGMIAFTLGSSAPASHVVQPRLEPPQTTKPVTARLPPASLAMNSCVAVIAATALLTMGRRRSCSGSREAANFTCWWAMMASSTSASPGRSANTIGWLGTSSSWTTTEPVSTASLMNRPITWVGAGSVLFPPVM